MPSVAWVLTKVSVVMVNSNALTSPQRRLGSRRGANEDSSLRWNDGFSGAVLYSLTTFERSGSSEAPYRLAIGSSSTISMFSAAKPLNPVRMALP